MAALRRSGDELLIQRSFVRTDIAVSPLLEEPCRPLCWRFPLSRRAAGHRQRVVMESVTSNAARLETFPKHEHL